ncbi:polysaccharide transporter [Subtercola boreus]|uniref:Polysaccharide transporter n=1 Tax=Subtercola boreus TaxID=120213 RepID=A0A3E0W786_9MICO|nr:polysaccharide transporter [Subtercola boreus]RFA18745.1 polysaccharide transporter [Subtercola boreus]RFA18862.1 polysaccharide transporter [Subtercola boreus]RFA25397.1 polysaccharide transporter [Subtercola boreus]
MNLGRLKLLLPVGAAGLTRVVQLVVLVVLLALSAGSEQSTLVAGFALLSSFAIFTDSGASSYLLSVPRHQLGRVVHSQATGVHVVLSTLGALAAVAITLLSSGSATTTAVVLVLAGLGVSQICDSVTRTTRAPQLVYRRDASYAIPDLALVLAKTPVLVLAVVFHRVELLALMAVPSLIVVLATYVANRRAIVPVDVEPERVFRSIAEFGLSGSLSALYSQAPLVIGTALLGVDAIAPLAVAYRVAQPLEVIPATISQQLIPRIRTLSHSFVRYWLIFVGLGLACALVLIVSQNLVRAVLGSESFDSVIFVLIVLSMGPKFGNYALVAYSMGKGYIRQRLIATITVGIIAVTLTVLACILFGDTALAGVTLLSELTLALTLSLLIRARSRKDVNR